MELRQFIFEKYTFRNSNRIFLGYKTVMAISNSEAYSKAQEKLDEDIVLFPIANPIYF